MGLEKMRMKLYQRWSQTETGNIKGRWLPVMKTMGDRCKKRRIQTKSDGIWKASRKQRQKLGEMWNKWATRGRQVKFFRPKNSTETSGRQGKSISLQTRREVVDKCSGRPVRTKEISGPNAATAQKLEGKWSTSGRQMEHKGNSFSMELFGESCGPRHPQCTTSTRQMEEHWWTLWCKASTAS